MKPIQAYKIAVKVLQKEQRTRKGLAIYYRDYGAPEYKPDYDNWVKLNEAIETLQELIISETEYNEHIKHNGGKRDNPTNAITSPDVPGDLRDLRTGRNTPDSGGAG